MVQWRSIELETFTNYSHLPLNIESLFLYSPCIILKISVSIYS